MMIHARRGGFLCVLLFFTSATGAVPAAGQQREPAKARTNSDATSRELTIVAAKVQMLLIAPDAKKTGYDSQTKKTLRAIPNSAYDQDALLAYDSGRVDPNTTQTIDVKHPTAGEYRLVVSSGTAADGEEYEVQVHLYLNGGEARTARIAGTVQRAKVATYELRVSADSATVVTVDHQRQK